MTVFVFVLCSIVPWIREHKIELRSTEVVSDSGDFEPFTHALKDVRYVGLGETTHGTHEFFTIKQRLVRFLVERMGFTVFAIESSAAACEAINDYVVNGRGDPKQVLANQGFWYWDTEEVLDLVEWLRAHNEHLPPAQRVRFVGVDIQKNTETGTYDRVAAYLNRVDPSLGAVLPAENERMHELLAAMEMRRGHYVNRSSADEFDRAYRAMTQIAQFTDFRSMTEGDRDWRDYFMANNFFRLVQSQPAGTKIVLWAHNSHITRNAQARVNRGTKPLGSYLAEEYGAAYYAMGFTFGTGGFRANVQSGGGIQPLEVAPADPDTFDGLLASAGGNFIIHFRDGAMPSDVGSFVTTPIRARNIGDNYAPDHPERFFPQMTIATDFDAIIFVEKTTPSRALQQQQRISDLMHLGGVPGLSIALIRDGRIQWHHAFGVANASTKQPLTDSSIFETASLTKPVFAYAVLKLVDAGVLALDTPLIHYLPEPVPDERMRRITARMVLSHTTGFQNEVMPGETLQLAFDPGTRFRYSGAGYIYLQRVVEHLTGKPLPQLMRELVFDPLKMHDTGYVWIPAYEQSKVYGHTADGTVRERRKPSTPILSMLHTTTLDYARFMIAMMNGGGEAMLEPQVRINDNISWGLGWALERTDRGTAFFHWGENNGDTQNFALGYPGGDGIVIFTNSGNGLTIIPEIVKLALGGEHPAFAFMGYPTHGRKMRDTAHER